VTEAVLRFSGIALIGVFASLLLKERYKAVGIAACSAAALIILIGSLNGGADSAVSAVADFGRDTGFSEHIIVLQKALGIGYITTVTGNICRDAGEGALASSVEFAGKVQILVLSLPLISSLLGIAKGLL